jgi:hypothetical protein
MRSGVMLARSCSPAIAIAAFHSQGLRNAAYVEPQSHCQCGVCQLAPSVANPRGHSKRWTQDALQLRTGRLALGQNDGLTGRYIEECRDGFDCLVRLIEPSNFWRSEAVAHSVGNCRANARLPRRPSSAKHNLQLGPPMSQTAAENKEKWQEATAV